MRVWKRDKMRELYNCPKNGNALLKKVSVGIETWDVRYA